MEYDPAKHVVHENGATIRCRTCNKYYDRCICGKEKGELYGLCNRSSCLSPMNVRWFNHSTKRYYCASCAHELNMDPCNYRDAKRMFGHELCTLEGTL